MPHFFTANHHKLSFVFSLCCPPLPLLPPFLCLSNYIFLHFVPYLCCAISRAAVGGLLVFIRHFLLPSHPSTTPLFRPVPLSCCLHFAMKIRVASQLQLPLLHCHFPLHPFICSPPFPSPPPLFGGSQRGLQFWKF